MKRFASEIYAAVWDGRLTEPFQAADVQRVCPGSAERSYRVFLAKHAAGNPGGNTELFERVGRGTYRIARIRGRRPFVPMIPYPSAPPCPRCGSRRVLKIQYGYPSAEAWDKEGITLGGCIPGPKQWLCEECMKSW